jgi:predicted transcriptional regulator
VIDESAIPARVRDLVRASLHSIEELEVLLKLHAGGRWTVAQLSCELRLPESTIEAAVQALAQNKLATQVGAERPWHYVYAPQAPEVQQAVDELAATYAENRVPILMFISSTAIERVREGALKAFADAFRLSGRTKDG